MCRLSQGGAHLWVYKCHGVLNGTVLEEVNRRRTSDAGRDGRYFVFTECDGMSAHSRLYRKKRQSEVRAVAVFMVV
jgi:hypothetical protein